MRYCVFYFSYIFFCGRSMWRVMMFLFIVFFLDKEVEIAFLRKNIYIVSLKPPYTKGNVWCVHISISATPFQLIQEKNYNSMIIKSKIVVFELTEP